MTLTSFVFNSDVLMLLQLHKIFDRSHHGSSSATIADIIIHIMTAEADQAGLVAQRIAMAGLLKLP